MTHTESKVAVLALALAFSAWSADCLGRTASGYKTQALPDSLWSSSQWISAADAPVVEGRIEGREKERSADGASWFVASLKNDRKVKKAVWMTAGLGVYELYVNGTPVGQEVLKPGFTHPYKTKRSFTYDVTDAFKTGKGATNQLGVQVTPGWWADKIVTPGGHDGMVGRKCAFRGVLQLTYDDGSVQTFGTDADRWKAGIAGPVKHAGIFDGEAYDARVEPGFRTPQKLSRPEVNTEFQGEILPSEGAEVYRRDDLALSPVKAYVWNGVEGVRDGEHGKVVVVREYRPGQEMKIAKGETLVIDFGQNAAAVPSFLFKGTEGTTLTCLPGEILNDGNGARSRGMDGPEGSVHRDNLRFHGNAIRLDYTFKGDKKYEAYVPQTTFYGYRYVSITADGDVAIKDVKSVPVTSISEGIETGRISTGNEMVNKLISNTVWGQRSNYLSVPTDCPQRDERLGWTADTQVFAETGTYFANTRDFFHKWTRDLRDSQGDHGGYPGVAPLAQYGNEMTRLGWSDAGIIVPWTVWKQFGDNAIVDENWAAMEKYMQHINDTKYDHQTLLPENGNYQWADWLSYEPLESCSGRAFTEGGPRPEAVDYWNYLSACYWHSNARMMADMAAATGRDAARYRAMADEAKAYVAEKFINPDGSFKTEILNTMQTPALFALRNDFVEGEARDNTVTRLRENFSRNGNKLQTGFLGTSILMPTLTENGMQDIAYEVLLQRENPSWFYSIDNGATTIWERWNSYMVDSGMGPQGMNSFNHYAYGVVCEWIWENVAGISADPASPGFKNIVMRPVPDRRLGHLDAEYQSAAGPVKSAWRYEGDNWIWNFSIPEGATATVYTPDGSAPRSYAAGTHTVSLSLP